MPGSRRWLWVAAAAVATAGSYATWGPGLPSPGASAQASGPAPAPAQGIAPRPVDPAGVGQAREPPPESSRPSPPPRDLDPDPRQREWSRGLLQAYRKWDASWVTENMQEGADPWRLEEVLGWFSEKLGQCSDPQPMDHRGEGYARFLYACDEGELEVGFMSREDDPSRINTLLLGARSVEPPPPTRRLAEEALRLIDTWDEKRFHTIFSDAFDVQEMEALFDEVRTTRGSCALEGVDLANARGAIWFIACENGPAMMKTDLDDDDQIRIFFIRNRRQLRLEP